MGILRLLADTDLVPAALLERVFVTDFEGTPWPCNARFVAGSSSSLREIQIAVEGDHSFYLQIPLRTASGSELMVSTATLRQREEPYLLALELLRGSIHRLTNQNFEWGRGGFALLEDADERISDIMKRFTAVATIPHDWERCHRQSMDILPDVIKLVSGFSDGITAELTRMNATAGIETLLAGNWQDQAVANVDMELFKSVFDTAIIDLDWPTIELSSGSYDWSRAKEQVRVCLEHGLRTISGPLLDFSPSNIPGWMENWQSDPGRLTSRAMEYAVRTVEALAGDIHLWNITSTMNQPLSVGLSDQARLQLTADVVQRVRRLEPKTPILVTFQQPWGEFLVGSEMPEVISPLRFADALVRGQIGVSALGLQLDLGSWPYGSVERDAIEILKRLDIWSRFQLPLVVFLSSASDPVAGGDSSDLAMTTHRSPTQNSQAATAKQMVQLLSAHPAVHGVVWNEWSDRANSRFPTCGIVDSDGNPKQAMMVLRELQLQQAAVAD